ncbi:hypothetical protein DN523_05970 [Burkholderia multivorans]|nr:hypothetical protein BURMUCGD1_5797 [Burkholderia multivorans CGD1]RAB08375.1 hypothetical protein DN515_22025 [Burkholderia multivorans]RAB47050.1 hypothetical protein DN518_16920 [Burkholderia multivorans]RAB71919.1 hypothetical protein DN568_01820 [Burkholderia multivorans]RAB76897.1 hypothetical protein DN565_06335 [Burkholderia multivorans]
MIRIKNDACGAHPRGVAACRTCVNMARRGIGIARGDRARCGTPRAVFRFHALTRNARRPADASPRDAPSHA